MTEKIKVAAGVLMLLIMGGVSEAAVCYLPSPGCGLQTPANNSNPNPPENKCTGGLYEECPTIDKTLQKCEKQGECYKVSCIYSGYSNCVANSSTNYCKQDAGTGCYKSAPAPVVCVGYNDTYEKTLDENCSCLQCEEDASKYSCECTEPVPETCSSYGKDLTPPKVYDTENALTCSDTQKKQRIGVIKNEEECYECVAKTCTDYGEFEKGKGNCGTGYEETSGDHAGCYKCGPKAPETSGDVCIKLNYICDGKACQGTNLEKFKELINKEDGLTVWGADGIDITTDRWGSKRTNYKFKKITSEEEDLYCISKEAMSEYIDTYIQEYKKDITTYNRDNLYTVGVFTIAFALDYGDDNYFDNHKFIFKDASDKDLEDTIYEFSVIFSRHEDKYYYYFMKDWFNIYDNGKPDVDGTIWGECDKEITFYDDDSEEYLAADVEEMLSCLKDKGFAELTSSPINVDINLSTTSTAGEGKPKCIEFVANCLKLDKNVRPSQGDYNEKLAINDIGYCIDGIQITITDSADPTRIRKYSDTYTNGRSETDSNYINYYFNDIGKVEENEITRDGENITIKICKLIATGEDEKKTVDILDYDTVTLNVGANLYTDSEGYGGYVLKKETDKCNDGWEYGNACMNKTYEYKPEGNNRKVVTFTPYIQYEVTCNSDLRDLTAGDTGFKVECGANLKSNRPFTSDISSTVSASLQCLANISSNCTSTCSNEYNGQYIFNPFQTASEAAKARDNNEKSWLKYVTTSPSIYTRNCYAQTVTATSCEITTDCNVNSVNVKTGDNINGYYAIVTSDGVEL